MTYLKHPLHGELVENNVAMVQIAKASGWVEFDPTPAPIPSFLAPSSDLPADFPGRSALIEGGLTTWASLIGKTAEQLQEIKGIRATTAANILRVMDS